MLITAVSRSTPEGIADIADTDAFTVDGSDFDGDSDSDDKVDRPHAGPPRQASALKIVQEFAIREEAFTDLLSDTPRYTSTTPPSPAAVPPLIPNSQIDWSW